MTSARIESIGFLPLGDKFGNFNTGVAVVANIMADTATDFVNIFFIVDRFHVIVS